MMTRLAQSAGLTALILLIVGSASGAQLSGQAGLTLYDYESQPPETVGLSTKPTSSHLISTQILSLDFHDIGASGLSFHTFFRNTSSLAPSDSTGSFFRLYGAYLDYRQAGAPFSVQAGRQFIVVGIANGTLDGLKARYDIGRRASVTGFAGLESHYDSLKVSSWKSGGMVGGEFSLTLPRESYLSLSGWQVNRDSALAKRRVGGDLITEIVPRLDLSGHAEGDLIKNRLYRAILRGETNCCTKVVLTARYEYRKPVFDEGSIFNTFEVSANQEAGAGLKLKTWKNLSLSGEAVREFFDNDHADRLSFGAQCGHGSLTYIRRTGYGGRSWGVNLNGDHSLGDRVDAGATLDYTRYEDRTDPNTRDYTFTGIVRLGLKIYDGFRITTDLENLVNPNYTQNTRLLVRALYDF